MSSQGDGRSMTAPQKLMWSSATSNGVTRKRSQRMLSEGNAGHNIRSLRDEGSMLIESSVPYFEEPDALIALVRICGGAARQRAALPGECQPESTLIFEFYFGHGGSVSATERIFVFVCFSPVPALAWKQI